MSALRPAALLGAALLALASRSAAQAPAASLCPDSGIAVVSADSLLARAARRLTAGPVDTTYTLSIARKQWSARDLHGSVAAGVVGTERASWAACAGAWVRADRADLRLENVQGRVRIRASVEPLLEVLRRHSTETQ
jgi:hypothetical protein